MLLFVVSEDENPKPSCCSLGDFLLPHRAICVCGINVFKHTKLQRTWDEIYFVQSKAAGNKNNYRPRNQCLMYV